MLIERLLDWYYAAWHFCFCRHAQTARETENGTLYVRCMGCGMRSAGVFVQVKVKPA